MIDYVACAIGAVIGFFLAQWYISWAEKREAAADAAQDEVYRVWVEKLAADMAACARADAAEDARLYAKLPEVKPPEDVECREKG